MAAITVQEIEAAADAISGVARRTPMLDAGEISRRAGVPVRLKAECLQATGSFKVRGAFNAISALGGDQLEAGLDRRVGVRDGLRLDALRRVDDEQRALAGGERARDLVGEVDVAGGVYEVQVPRAVVSLVEDAYGLGFDRYSPLAFEVHGVEDLVHPLAFGDRLGYVEEPVREGAFSVVYVRDYAEIARAFDDFHLTSLP